MKNLVLSGYSDVKDKGSIDIFVDGKLMLNTSKPFSCRVARAMYAGINHIALERVTAKAR